MRKRLAAVILTGMLAMSGCADGGVGETTIPIAESTPEQKDEKTSEEENTVSDFSDLEEATELSEEEIAYLNMVSRSLISIGNNYRMKQVMERARAGEDITIAYIGGSITEGYNAGTSEIYAKLSYEYFADRFGSRDTVHYVNAGLSGTPSTLGLIRSDRDVFSEEPDILFIEFAVNDGGQIDRFAYDSLIMKALSQENEPAVVLLFSVIESGYTCQDTMQLTGYYYGLPLISVKNAIWPEIEAGRMTWDDWSDDESHPNKFGQSLYAEFIINYYKAIETRETDEKEELPDSVKWNRDLTGMKMYDKNNLEILDMGSFSEKNALSSFTEGWVKDASDTENKSFTFEFDGKELFLVYKDTANKNFGTAEVYVDGKKAAVVEGNSADGWNNPVAECVYQGEEGTHHKVEIRMAEGDEDKEFDILCFGIVP